MASVFLLCRFQRRPSTRRLEHAEARRAAERRVLPLTSRLYLMKQAGNMDGAPGFKLEKFAKTLLSPTSAGGSQGCLMFIHESFCRCSAVFIYLFSRAKAPLLDSWTFLELQTKCRLDAKLSLTTLCGPGPDLRARLLPLTFLRTDSLLRPLLVEQIERFLCLLSTLACTNWSASFWKCSGPSHGQNVEL